MLSFLVIDFVLNLLRIKVDNTDDLIASCHQIWNIVYFARGYICSV